MPHRIEDYALIGDTRCGALIGRDGSVDWLCWPRFDSEACFAALLGEPKHGRWLFTPRTPITKQTRRYRGETLILETELTCAEGSVLLTDFMPLGEHRTDFIRIVEGKAGSVDLHMELAARFGYGNRRPWVHQTEEGWNAKAGPNALLLRTHVPVRNQDTTLVADFTVKAGERVSFHLTGFWSHMPAPSPLECGRALQETEQFWSEWIGRCTYDGPYRGPVRRSLLTLKALTYSPTGGMVAAATTSLPEMPGGVRNWDYRYCWLRDATLTLTSLVDSGYHEEANAWRQWLLRAAAGDADDLQIMYGVAGERTLTEMELPWLPGYEHSQPVRIGNAASEQHQLDVYGEVMDCLYQSLRAGVAVDDETWNLQLSLMGWLEKHWNEPDAGIWEVRGGPQQFTHSKVMAWVAVDRMVKTVETYGARNPDASALSRWQQLRQTMHEEICARGYDAKRNAFMQAFGSPHLDASCLMLPLVGFLPPDDPRIVGTVEAIQRELTEDGLVRRYHTHSGADGLPPGEGSFLACSFWMADSLALIGRQEEAEQLYERLLGLCNDVGLLAEQYFSSQRRQVGNFPQAFSHLSLIGTAHNLLRAKGSVRRKA